MLYFFGFLMLVRNPKIGKMVRTLGKKDSDMPVELDMSEIDKKFKDRANGKDTGKGSR